MISQKSTSNRRSLLRLAVKRAIGSPFQILVAVLLVCLLARTNAAEHLQRSQLVREIFVPFADLNVILEAGGQRVFMEREKYEALVQQARRTAEAAPPHAYSMASADYDITVQDGKATIQGRLVIDVAAKGIHAIDLDLGGVGLREATLDGQPASIAQVTAGKTTLFVSGVGQHAFALEMVTPLEVAAARQTLRFRLPKANTGRMRAIVPGDVEIRSGATVLTRTVDQAAEVTRFELLPTHAETTLVMSLNNRTAQLQQVVTASNVYVVELTDAYQRLHVTHSMKVLHGAVEQFRIAVPADHEIIDVSTPLLSRWEISDDVGPTGMTTQRTLTVRLREPLSDIAVLNIAAERAKPNLENWQLPRLQPLDVVSSVSIVGVLVESRLETQSLAADELLPIDTRVLTETLPTTIFAAEPGAPKIQPIAAYYAPRADYDLTASFARPSGRVQVVSNTVLTLQDAGLEVRGGFALLPIAERIFGCHFTAPPNWTVSEVNYGDGQELDFEVYENSDGSSRVRVRLPQSVEPGEGYGVYFRATRTPDGWLGSWDSQSVEFPQFPVLEATSDRGAVAVVASDDLAVAVDQMTGLVPLDSSRKTEFNLESVPTDLALEYAARPFAATLAVSRKSARITAETYSFLKLSPGRLDAHYEILYDIREARARQLTFRLPVETPNEISVHGVSQVAVKEFNSVVEGDSRLWTVDLAQPIVGVGHLAVSFEQPLLVSDDNGQSQTLDLPMITASNVEYQTGSISVEGSAELEISLSTDARRVDAGELVDARYQPGRRLLGAYGFVGQPAAVTATYSRPKQHGLPSAIVQRAELVTVVSRSGVSQSAARFLLRTKASFIEVQLPADSTLWSVYLDGAAAKPQRDDDRLLISLPANKQLQMRDLQIVYETNHGTIGLWGDYQTVAPQLFLRAQSDDDPGAALPTADLNWYLHLPPGYRLATSRGTVQPNLMHQETIQQIGNHETPALRTAEQLATHGVGSLLFQSRYTVREAARRQTTAGFQKVDAEMQTLGAADSAPADMPAPPTAEAPQVDDLFGDEIIAQDSRAGRAAQFENIELADTTTPEAAPDEDAAGIATTATRQSGIKRYWALEGLRSLPIDLTTSERPVLFQSLGERPELDVRLIHQRRTELMALGASLVALVLGLRLLGASWRAKFLYVGAVLILASIVPLVSGFDRELGVVFDWCFYGGLVLLPIYLFRSLVSRLAKCVEHVPSKAVASLLFISITLAASMPTRADEPAAILGPLEVKLLEGLPQVDVPADAVIVPFALDGPVPTTSERVIVPLATYERLQELAFPDTDQHAAPPAPYAIAGARWRTELIDGDHLEIDGSVTIDVLSEKTVTVWLPFHGGVLRTARLADKPAQLQIVQPQQHQARILGPNAAPNQAAQTRVDQASQIAEPPAAMMAVYIQGRGRHELTLTTHYPLSRRGGWRIAEGHLPAAVATSLTVTVPNKDTQVRLGGVTDRTSYETANTNQRIETALASSGQFQLQWRPRVAESIVDQSLTVESEGVFDVQEDRLRLTWLLQLKFPRAQRDSFTLRLPAGYLVEGIDGENLRNWQNTDGQLRIELLKPARDTHQITVRLATASPVREGQSANVDVPVVQVPDAALHEGRLAIRRGPLIELQTGAARGVMRTDWASVTSARQVSVISPLGIRAFQAYQYNRVPFELSLSATPLPTRTTATLETVLRIGEGQRTTETRVNLQSSGKPVYRVILDLPVDCEITDVDGPEPLQWSTTTGESGRQLRVFFGSGQTGDFSLFLHSRLGARGSVQSVAVPRFQVQDVARQETSIVVQTDPSYAVTAESLVNCTVGLLSDTHGWLAPAQRTLARLAIRSDQTDYSGALQLTRRTPRVTCQTVSNLRVTERAFEETVLLNYTIRDAGIREVSFLLPSDLRDARVTTQLLQTKVIEQVAGNGDVVRVRLTLQDEVIGELRVLVEHDRLLTTNQRAVPIPTVENARADQQFVAIESVGRDEVIIDTQQQLEPLSRQQSSWRTLASILGDSITQAFQVQSSATNPRLVVSTQDRQAVETVAARIAYAQAVLVIDASGAYRAAQRYYVNNRTEQFLTIQLPAGASLWTAVVAGQPVKPISASQVDRVRIPLVKTAEGENDYVVELKYGGRTSPIGRVSRVDFPLMTTLNIKAEASQVILRLPESHRWFSFGGTMRQVNSEADFFAAFLKYQNEQITKFTKGLNTANPYARARSANNIRQLALSLSNYERQAQQLGRQSVELRQSMADNRRAIETAQQELQRLESVQRSEQQRLGNRDNLYLYFDAQSNTVAKDLVNEQKRNFEVFQLAEELDQKTSERESQGQGQIDRDWLESNKLRNIVVKEADEAETTEPEARVQIEGKLKKGRGKAEGYHLDLFRGDAAQKKLPAKPQSEQQSQRGAVDRVRRFERQLQVQQQQLAGAELTPTEPSAGPALANQMEQTTSGLDASGAGRVDGMAQGAGGRLGGGGFGGSGLADPSDGQLAAPDYGQLGFVSLDVVIPQRGQELRFTTPRGDTVITARAVDESLSFRATRLLAVAVIIVIVLLGAYIIRAMASHFRASPLTASLLMLGGMIVAVLGYPVLFLVLFGLGSIVFLRWLWLKSVPAPGVS